MDYFLSHSGHDRINFCALPHEFAGNFGAFGGGYAAGDAEGDFASLQLARLSSNDVF
jgi:hypothetical protein